MGLAQILLHCLASTMISSLSLTSLFRPLSIKDPILPLILYFGAIPAPNPKGYEPKAELKLGGPFLWEEWRIPFSMVGSPFNILPLHILFSLGGGFFFSNTLQDTHFHTLSVDWAQ